MIVWCRVRDPAADCKAAPRENHTFKYPVFRLLGKTAAFGLTGSIRLLQRRGSLK
jgi:hypothetical protein